MSPEEQAADIMREFAKAVAVALDAMREIMRLVVVTAEQAVAAIRRWLATWLPIFRRRLMPTPWHMKRARVQLRRNGRPVTTAAAMRLAMERHR